MKTVSMSLDEYEDVVRAHKQEFEKYEKLHRALETVYGKDAVEQVLATAAKIDADRDARVLIAALRKQGHIV